VDSKLQLERIFDARLIAPFGYLVDDFCKPSEKNLSEVRKAICMYIRYEIPIVSEDHSTEREVKVTCGLS
jgi:hypothetical protein